MHDICRASEAPAQDMITGAGKPLYKVLDASRRRETKGVDALIVVPRNKQTNAARSERVHELQIHGVKVLVFVNDQFLHVHKLGCGEKTGFDLLDTHPDDLAEVGHSVRSASSADERLRTLLVQLRVIGGSALNVVRRVPLTRAPEGLMLAPDLVGSLLPKLGSFAKFRVEDILDLPVIQTRGLTGKAVRSPARCNTDRASE